MSHHHRHRHDSTPHPQHPSRMQHSHTPVHSNRRNRGGFPRAQRAGDKVNYHVLKCRPVVDDTSPQQEHDHLQVLLEAGGQASFWMTINIRSGDDRVFYTINENYGHPITQKIAAAGLRDGFTHLKSAPGELALDYIREKLVDLPSMDELDPAGQIPDDEGIADMLTTQLVNVSRSPDAVLYVFGSRFDDGEKFSSYHLPTGIHDIHMNQGSIGQHQGSNGIFQDGALLVHYPSEDRWSAVFLKFATQAEQTDDHGNAV
jgi:uncharacterized protein YukJ